MKSFVKAALLALALSPVAALADEAVDVKITGMHCGACTNAVKKELAGLKGIDKKSISVELEGNHAILKVKKNDEKTQAAIKSAVEKAGYKVASIDLVGAAPAAGGTTAPATGETKSEPAKAN
jgi:copper chaperone CopZ